MSYGGEVESLHLFLCQVFLFVSYSTQILKENQHLVLSFQIDHLVIDVFLSTHHLYSAKFGKDSQVEYEVYKTFVMFLFPIWMIDLFLLFLVFEVDLTNLYLLELKDKLFAEKIKVFLLFIMTLTEFVLFLLTLRHA